MAEGDLIARHAEVSESFEKAELTRAWQSEDPDRAGVSPASLNGAELADYQSWESATRAAWEASDSRVAKEYDRLRVLGLGQVRGAMTISEPALPRNWDVADLYRRLRKLAGPPDRDGKPLDVKALPEAWTAARRNSRDLPAVLDAMTDAAAASLTGPAAQAYGDSRSALHFANDVFDAKTALGAWTKLITSSASPDAKAMTTAAEAAEAALGRVRSWVDPIAADIKAQTGITVDELPAPMTDGIIMYVAAVADELCNQYVARVADPSFGLMFERICEIPARGDVPDCASPNYAGSATKAQQSAPDKAMKLVAAQLDDAQGLTLGDYSAQALQAAVEATDFKRLGKSWDAWIQQLGKAPRQDMAVLQASVSDLAFGLERLRSAVVSAFPDAQDAADTQAAALQAYCLAPIDGLIALMQAQAEKAKRTLV